MEKEKEERRSGGGEEAVGENLSSACSSACSSAGFLLYLFAGDEKPRLCWPVQLGTDAEVFRDGAVKIK
jgi:hypothetical protein